MSGHSHWAGIKQRKGVNDAKRANIFTKLGRFITIAAREGGGNPEFNFKLNMAIEQARAANIPKDNIDKAIKRGTGELKDSAEIQEAVYEAYGPNGIMMVIKALTDNKNRTVSEIKTILAKFGGKFGEQGSTMWNFEYVDNEYKPKNIISIDEKNRSQYEKLLESLEELDDVQEIFDNL